jgi:hypothetical protein
LRAIFSNSSTAIALGDEFVVIIIWWAIGSRACKIPRASFSPRTATIAVRSSKAN